MFRSIAFTGVLLTGLCSQALGLGEPRRATALPDMDWNCFSSFIVTFAPLSSGFEELGLDGDNLKKPRIQLITVAGYTLKVIENPTDAARRKERGIDVADITEDFTKNNPVFAWREVSGSQLKVYAFQHAHKVLSVTTIQSTSRAANSSQVFVCR